MNCSTTTFLLLCSALTFGPSAMAAPLLDTPFGPVVGSELSSDVEAYLGIPFAAPPLGEKRWKSPSDPNPWTEPRNATAHGEKCMQMGDVVDPISGETIRQAVGSEDCLYLNVWRPSTPSDTPRPVLFWIHGGSNSFGSPADPATDGAKLAEQFDVIVVSTQYRVNTSGYLFYAPLQKGDELSNSGNFGILDQIKALQWVQQAAPELGADASQVMIFGESAGAYNVWSLQMSPITGGLFSSAAAESGCPAWIKPDEAIAQGHRIVEAQVVADGLATEEDAAAFIEAQGEQWIHDYLYNRSAADILETIDALGLSSFNFNAMEDGHVIPEGSIGRFMTGDYQGVPTIVGANRDESKAWYGYIYPISPIGYQVLSDALFGESIQEIEALYPARDYRGPDLSYERLVDMSDGYFELVCSMHAGLVASEHHDVWLYRFDYDRLVPPYDVAFGAYHTAEIPFVFGTHEDSDFAEGTQNERNELASTMMAAWTCMAKTGSPDSCQGSQAWPRLDPSNPLRMTFDASSKAQIISAKEQEKIDYWVQWGNFGEVVGLKN